MRKSTDRQYSVAVAAFLLMFASGISQHSVAYFMDSIIQELSCNRAVFSIFNSILSVCSVFLSPFIVPVIRRMGYRKAFLLGTIGVDLGFWVLSRLNSIWMLYLGGALIGLAQPFIIVPPVSLVNRSFPEKNGFIMGCVMAGNGVAGVVLAQLLPRVIEGINWQAGFLTCAVCWAACTLAANALAGHLPSGDMVEKKTSNPGEKHSDIYSLGFVMLLLCVMLKNITSTFTQHMNIALSAQYPTERLIVLLTAFNVVLVLGKISVGVLYDKLGAKFVLLFLIPFGSLGFLGFITSRFYGLSLISVALFAICCCFETVVYPLFLRQLYDRDFASAAWGTCRAASTLGNSVGAPLWGAIYDQTGSYNLGLIASPCIITAICVYQTCRLKKKNRL